LSALKRQRFESSSLVDSFREEGRSCSKGSEVARCKSEEMPVRKKQTIIGAIKVNIIKQYTVLLIVDDWPTFLIDYFLPSSDNCLWIYCPRYPDFFASLLPKFCKWIEREEVLKLVKSGKCSWLVIQGDAGFIEESLGT
jgi:hypothetical protein